MIRRVTYLLCFLFVVGVCYAQRLMPGFDKEEYIALMKVSAQFGDSTYAAKTPPASGYRLLYQSPVMGLDNRWELWQTNTGIPIISIRGTTKSQVSWAANFYAAMVPAKGTMQLSKIENFEYQLAEGANAAVHTGWLIATGFLSIDILKKLDSCYRNGSRNAYIIGHSQGGAVAFLLTAYLRQLQQQGKLPADLQLKTYCSAAPKPGNLYFAYEYEAMTQGGWAYNVVNTEDWVPQTPFSVQTVDDLAKVNPFVNAKAFIRKSKWPERWALSYAYGQLINPGKKARKNYQKYLGRFVSKSIKKALPGFQAPVYFKSSNYVRTGTTIILRPGADYFEKFPGDKKDVFRHHLHEEYIYLADQLKTEQNLNEQAMK